MHAVCVEAEPVAQRDVDGRIVLAADGHADPVGGVVRGGHGCNAKPAPCAPSLGFVAGELKDGLGYFAYAVQSPSGAVAGCAGDFFQCGTKGRRDAVFGGVDSQADALHFAVINDNGCTGVIRCLGSAVHPVICY